MSKLERSFDFILNLFAGIAAVLLVVMMLATVLKVVLRALFNHGILGIDQISGTMMVYITFLGAAWVLRRDGHVAVDIVTANLRPQVQRGVMFVSSLIGNRSCRPSSRWRMVTVFSSSGFSPSVSKSIVTQNGVPASSWRA